MELIQGFNILTDKLNIPKLNFIINNKYLYAIFILILTIILATVILFFIGKYIKTLVAKTTNKVDDQIINVFHKPIYYFILLLGFNFAIFPLKLPIKLAQGIQSGIYSIMVVIGIITIVKGIDIFIGSWGDIWAKKTKSDIDDELLPFFHKTSKIIFFIFGFLFILKIWGVNITGFLAGLGIAGIAIGFAVKDSLGNIFGGISLLLDKSIKVGDRIKLESGEMGEIEEVGLRSTKLRTFDNDLLIIPSGLLANQKVQNYTLPDKKLKVKVFFGVEYGSKIEDVKKVVLTAVKNLKNVSKEIEPNILFLEMADFSLNFRCDIWVDDYKNAFATKIDATEAIYNALNKSGIGIPFPTRTVYTKKAL